MPEQATHRVPSEVPRVRIHRHLQSKFFYNLLVARNAAVVEESSTQCGGRVSHMLQSVATVWKGWLRSWRVGDKLQLYACY
jgi:hypothetical protein